MKQKAPRICHRRSSGFTLEQKATGICLCSPTLWPSTVYHKTESNKNLSPSYQLFTAKQKATGLVNVLLRCARQQFTLGEKSNRNLSLAPRYNCQRFTLKQKSTGTCHWPHAVTVSSSPSNKNQQEPVTVSDLP